MNRFTQALEMLKSSYDNFKINGSYDEHYGHYHIAILNHRLEPHGYMIEKNRGWGESMEIGYFVSRFHGTLSNSPFIRAFTGHREDVFTTKDPQALETWLGDNIPTRTGLNIGMRQDYNPQKNQTRSL